MKKKVIAAATLAAVLLTGLGAALAAPGTASDPFVTLSYLTGTYYAETEQAMLQRAQEATAETEQAALAKLDALASSYLAQAGGGESVAGWEYADQWLRLSLSRGDKLEIPTGAGLLFEAGQGTLAIASGTLVDVTSGGAVTRGGTLTAGHRYVAAEDAAGTFTAVTDAAILYVQGSYDLERTGETQTPFTDLVNTAWYYPYVRFVYENNLYNGTAATVFSPNTNMNRAMLATVLQRLAGVQGTAPSAGFLDVASGAWYADAVNWAAGANIVTGYEDNKFYPLTEVSREQMAVMLYRYAKDYLGRNISASGSLSGFPDHAETSSWAAEALSWAVDTGIITGYDDGTLGPGRTASRAVVATMLQRFSDYLSQTEN